MKGLASRRVAVEILLKVEQDGAFANKASSAAFENKSLNERDRALITYIVQGTLRHKTELDEELSKFSKIKLNKLSLPILLILRSALFQLIHMDDMPPSAVVNTAVEIARKMGHEGSAKFVNGVLRAFERAKKEASGGAKAEPGSGKELSQADGELANTESVSAGNEASDAESNGSLPRLAKKFSLPEWMISRWLNRFGKDETSSLLQYSQSIPRLILRSSHMSITTDGLIDIFKSKGMQVEKSKLMPDCIIVLDRGPFSGPVNKLPGYSEGLFVVQDDASAFVSTVLSASPGQTIVDLCAAPGGKSLHLGEIMENKGRVVAVDNSEKRLSLLAKERRRLSLTNIEAVVADGRKYKPEQAVDAVLLDAPCSGTGVINRRSDLRWHREESDIESLVQTQRGLLENAVSMLKPGAVLVYSTCSMEKEENQDIIEWFMQTHSGFKLDNLEPFFNEELLQSWSAEKHWSETQKQLQSGYIQLLPSRHGCSGFFICRIKRDD